MKTTILNKQFLKYFQQVFKSDGLNNTDHLPMTLRSQQDPMNLPSPTMHPCSSYSEGKEKQSLALRLPRATPHFLYLEHWIVF